MTLLVTSNQSVPEELQFLLNKFNDIFQAISSLPPARLQDHRIPLKDKGAVVKVKLYMCPVTQKSELEELVREMLKVGIRDISSPFASFVVMVKKKDRTWRLCVDYRHLNQLIKDRFPIPIIEELLDELRQSRIFFKLDLKSCYH